MNKKLEWLESIMGIACLIVHGIRQLRRAHKQSQFDKTAQTV